VLILILFLRLVIGCVIMGSEAFYRSIVHTLTAVKRKPASRVLFLYNHYPAFYRFVFASLRDKRCPFCGFQLKAQYSLASHMKSPKCQRILQDLVEMMISRKGKPRASEEEIFNYINQTRSLNGLSPVNVDDYR